MKKRILSIVLAICLVLSLVPTTAFADITKEKYVVAGISDLCGSNWDPASPDNVMTDNDGDGTYQKVYTNVAVMDGYQFKVVKYTPTGESIWYGIDGGYENFKFNVKSVCDVTITFDTATLKITVTGDDVEIPTTLNVESMRVIGDGNGNWLNGVEWDPSADENLMKEVSPGVFEITYTDIGKSDNHQVKFAANGSWFDNWGGVYQGSGIESDAEHNSSDNITIEVPYERADVTLRLDLTNFDYATKTGAKFTVTVTNKAKSDFTYTVSDDNKVTITGYTGTATDVVIPSAIEGKTVTTIGQSAFWNQTKITSVTIPGSVKTIGAGAFGSCRGLTSIAIPGSVTYIGSNPFYNCSKLTSIKVDDSNTSYSSVDGVLFNKEQTVLAVYPCGKTGTSYTIPGSVTSIKDNAFRDCLNLTSVEIPGSVTSIGTEAFYNCRRLTSIDIPGSVTSIGDSAFAFCASLTSVTLHHGVTSIGNNAFQDCGGLISIEIPGSVTSIGANAFQYCGGLISIEIPGSVTSIGANAFQYCEGLTSIEIPGSVTSIGTAAFYNCKGLDSIFLPNDLYVTNAEIPNTTSQVRYSLDETAGEVTITAITLGTDKTGVAIPATICGYPVVAISDESLLTKISSHTCAGGQATCQNKAICRICKQEYGEKKPDNHTGKLVWATTETQHKKYWDCCNAVVVDYEDHTWNNGVCSECDYTCTHKDTDKNHACDYCDANVGTHADINLDHKCDYGCSEAIGTHADINLDHKCDYGCSETIGAHADINLDHKCDYGCSEAIGTHADTNSDHKCDYGCSEAIGAHEDTNRDHNCDYCHEQITTCTDENPKDHICDICTATLSQHSGGFSTCISRAKCDYCGQYYGTLDHNWHHLEHINAVPATESKTGNKEYWHCLDCGKYFADEKGTNEIKLDDTVIAKLPPEIIKGKGQSIVAGENKELSFTSNAAFSDFLRVELDGKTLDEKYYTVKEGSTVVTLKADYVATLSVGEHTIGIVSTNGTATTTFTVKAKTAVDNDTDSPQTGDNSNMALWIALLAASMFGFAGTAVYSKRKRVR